MDTAYWKRRIDIAESRGEPLYVTPDEWNELRQGDSRDVFGRQMDSLSGRDAMRRFIGTLVVVDTDAAARQRASSETREP